MLARIALVTVCTWFAAVDAAAEEVPRPKLVLFLTIDQARGDYLERFRPALSHGLATLLDKGVVFANAHHHHATTVTAPGHASLATGLFPSSSGIVGNDWFDRGENRNVYCVEDLDAPLLRPSVGSGRGAWSTSGRSPRNLLGTSLSDWMKAAHPDTKVYSVGGKDRSAILIGGKRADGTYWYDSRSGQWVTSRYYRSEYPSWAREFHLRRAADDLFGLLWEPVPFEEALLESMEVVASGDGTDDDGIPKTVGRGSLIADPSFYAALFDSPFVESLLFDFARALVRAERLGQRETTDYLALSFASVDAVGHQYGPNSREVLDTVVRLDRELGRFFEFLEETVGMEKIGIALSSDHGVAPLPEYRRARGLPAGRFSSKDFECFQSAGKAFEREFGKADWFLAPFYFDRALAEGRGVELDEAAATLSLHLSRCAAVRHVFTRRELESTELSHNGVDPVLELYRNGYHPERSPDLFVQLEKWHIQRSRGTTHGSAWEYDTHVPVVLVWPGAKAGVVSERMNTVDVPVTLAHLLGIDVPPGLDGIDRSILLRR